MTLYRESYCKDSVETELAQVPKKISNSWGFSKPAQIVTLLIPVFVDIFSLPGEGAAEGSDEWINALMKRNSYTFQQLVTYPKLLHKYLKKMCDDLDEENNLKLWDDEPIPTREYSRSRTYEYLETGK